VEGVEGGFSQGTSISSLGFRQGCLFSLHNELDSWLVVDVKVAGELIDGKSAVIGITG